MQELPYARPDGLYPDMTVGAVIGADETAQWAQRESTGTGSATVRSVKGAAIGYNQLVPDGNFTDATKWRPQASLACSTSIADNTLRVTVIDNTVAGRPNAQPVTALETAVLGHKYLLRAEVFNNTGAICFAGILYATNTGPLVSVPSDGEWHKYAQFVTCSSETATLGMLYVDERVGTMQNGAYVEWRNYTIIDLTQMFGSGNEPTAAEFERMYPESYYPYSAPTLKPVQIAGIRSTDAQGGELDSVEWDTFTLRGAGSIGDMLYSDRKETKVGVVDLGTLAWARAAETSGHPYFYSSFYGLPAPAVQPAASLPNATCAIYQRATFADLYNNYANVPDGSIGLTNGSAGNNSVYIKDDEVTDVTALRTKLSGVLLFYELATPTTQPISPALPMTYKVQQGGSESVIVPDGEVSAAPVLTVAEPVNMSTELARIWAAIEQLQSHGTAQLSRADAASIEEVQKDTAEIAEIDTTKEVTE